jgi:antitoxin YefM
MEGLMDHVSYTELRQNLKKHMDDVCQNRAPLMVTRQSGEPVVMLSLAEYESLEETLHLLRDPANASRLLRAIKDAEAGALSKHDIAE